MAVHVMIMAVVNHARGLESVDSVGDVHDA